MLTLAFWILALTFQVKTIKTAEAGVSQTSPEQSNLVTEPPVDKTLRFNKDHEFVILQLTDLHYGDSNDQNQKTTAAQEKIIQAVKPDLIVVTGDAVSGYVWDKKTQGFYKAQWELFTAPYRKLKTRYAYVFGNHDIETDLTPHQIGDLDRTHPYSLFNGDTTADSKGYSNYILPIFSSLEGRENQQTGMLWMFDTRKTGCNGKESYYGCIDQEQIDWYKKQSESLKFPSGSKIPGLAFFHIPIPEYVEVWNYHYTFGSKNETVGCPSVNSNAFEAFRVGENIKALFCGHDHTNDYGGLYQGIELIYGRKTGYGSYGPINQKGGRVIKLKETIEEGKSDPSLTFETYIFEEDGNVVKPEPAHWQGYTQYQKECHASILVSVLGLIWTIVSLI